MKPRILLGIAGTLICAGAAAQSPADVRAAVEAYWRKAPTGFMDIPGLGNCPEYFQIESAVILDQAAQAPHVKAEVKLVLRPKSATIAGGSAIVEVCANGVFTDARLDPAARYNSAPIIVVLSKWSSGWRVDHYLSRHHRQ